MQKTIILTAITTAMLATPGHAADKFGSFASESDPCVFSNFMKGPKDILVNANKGDACSQYQMATASKNPKTKQAWLTKASNNNLSIAQYKLFKLIVSSNPDKGVDWLNKAVKSGYTPAVYRLGQLYATGEYVKRDLDSACKLFKQATAGGGGPEVQAGAENNAGVCFAIHLPADTNTDTNLANQEGGDLPDPDQSAAAISFLQRAIAHDSVFARFNLAYLYEQNKDNTKAIEWYKKAAEGPTYSVTAQVVLGDHFRAGDIINKDSKKALSLYLKAAGKGSKEGRFQAGSMYRTGEGVGKSEEQAVNMFKVSSRGGYSSASLALAEMHSTGWTVYRKVDKVDKDGEKTTVTVAKKIYPDIKAAGRFKNLAAEQAVKSFPYKQLQFDLIERN